MAHLSLHLLGPFHVTLDGEPATGFKYDHVRALLAYLAVEANRPHRRERLAGILWPDQPHAQALSNLRYALYNLRNVLRDRRADPPFLTPTRQILQFNIDSDHWLDVRAFERHVEEGRSAQEPLSLPPVRARQKRGAIHHLEAAVALCQGPFMEGFSLVNSPAFEAWQLLRREYLTQRLARALHRLIQMHVARGAYQRAEPHARRLIALEPWDEEAHRQLMRLLTLSGRRGAALAHYEACRRRLAEELGEEPSDETTSLYHQIREGLVGHLRGLGSPPPPSDRSSPFVARDQELARLGYYLREALAGQGRVAFITGDDGSGKSTLMETFAQRAMAAHGDLIAASGTCNAHGGVGDPYLPFRDILRMLVGDIEARRASGAITADHARRLWKLFPNAVRALADVGPDLINRFVPARSLALRAEAFAPGDTGWRDRIEALTGRQVAGPRVAESTQADLFEQLTRVLQTLARRYPMLLLLDDLQWADAGTASLLFHLGRRLTGHRILIVGAYRPAELIPRPDGKRHPMASILHELQRHVGDTKVDLNQADGRAFVDAFLDSEPNRLGADFRETLYRHTEGNPLFTVELLRGLQEEGDLAQDASGRWTASPDLAWQRLPARVEGVIAEHIARMSPDCRETLTVASVEGEAFTAEVVARVQDVDERQVIRRLSGPLTKEHRLVKGDSVRHVEDRRLSRYRFRHALFRSYLYQSLGSVERARLHEAVARALEDLHGEEVSNISGQLARHFEAAGMMPQAVDYLLQAGQEAVRLSANEEAVALFRRALGTLASLPASPQRDRREFALRLALYAPLTATRGYACPEVARSDARVHALSLRVGEDRELIPALISLAGLHSFQAEFQHAMDLGERALALAEREGAPGQVVWASQVLGMTAMYRGDLLTARRHLERTRDAGDADHKAMLAVRGRDPRVVYRSFASWVLWFLGYPDQAEQLGREAVSLAEEADHPPSLAMALIVGRGVPHALRRDYEVIPRLVKPFKRLAAAHSLGLSEAGAHLIHGLAMVRQGHSGAGIEEMHRGLSDWRATGTQAWASLYHGLLADACLVTGRLVEAQAALDEAFAAVRETGERMVEAELCRLRGELLLAEGDQEEAEASFQKAIQVARGQGARSWELRSMASLARLWGQQGRREKAHRALAEVYGWFREGFETPDLQEARRLLEALSAHQDDVEIL